MAKITMDNFAKEVEKVLEEYADDVNDNMKTAVHEVGKLGVRLIRQTARQKIKSKEYHKGFRLWSETRRLSQIETIYNQDHPGIAHLLEHGHALRGGGRSSTEAREHFAPVEAEMETAVMKELEAKL